MSPLYGILMRRAFRPRGIPRAIMIAEPLSYRPINCLTCAGELSDEAEYQECG